MECSTELVLTLPWGEKGDRAISFLKINAMDVYSCEFVETLQDRLIGTSAAQVLAEAPYCLAYALLRAPKGEENDVMERLRRDFNGEDVQLGQIIAAEINHQVQLSQPAAGRFVLGGQHANYMTMMNVHAAHSSGVTGSGRSIAILDTGIDASSSLPLGIEMIDALREPVTRNALRIDNCGHGTAMATLCSEIAPGAKVVMIRICDNGNQVSIYGVLAGVFLAAVDCAADIISLSLGFPSIRKCGVCGASGPLRSFALESAMNIARIAKSPGGAPRLLHAASVGNAGMSSGIDQPASYACVIPVGSIDSTYNRSSFSNYDAVTAHNDLVMAPGGQVLGNQITEEVGVWSSTVHYHGTSVATAYISGMLALLWSDQRYQKLDATAFLAAVEASHCKRRSSQSPYEYGHGLIHFNPPQAHPSPSGLVGHPSQEDHYPGIVVTKDWVSIGGIRLKRRW